MKKKLIVEFDNEIKKYICNVEYMDGVTEIKYKERPDVEVILTYQKNLVKIKKSGGINMHVIHELDLDYVVEYEIKLGGDSFSGQSNIKTTKLNISKDLIDISYLRDEESVDIKFEIA